MDIFAQSFIKRIEKSCLNAYRLGAENGHPENYENPEKRQPFKDQIATLCQLEQTMTDEVNLINRFDCNSVEDFDKEYKKALEEMKQNAPSVAMHPRFINFLNDIDSIVVTREELETQPKENVAIDEDIEMDGTQVTEMVDPFTKQPIRDPVRNTRCNHIYDRESITNAIRANKRTKCAYVGCSNKQPVTFQHLQEDQALKAKLTQAFTLRQENFMIDDDDDDDDDEEQEEEENNEEEDDD